MPQVIAAILTLTAVVIPLLFAVSTPRRRLELIRDLAATHDALPDGHPGRAPLSAEMKTSVEDFADYMSRGVARLFVRVCVIMLVYGVVIVGVGTWIAGEQLVEDAALRPLSIIFSIAGWVAIFTALIALGVVFPPWGKGLMRMSSPRLRAEIQRKRDDEWIAKSARKRLKAEAEAKAKA